MADIDRLTAVVLDHRLLDAAQRGQLAPPQLRSNVLLGKSAPGDESMVLATCHRTELYTYGERPWPGVMAAAGVPQVAVDSHIETVLGPAAFRHLCRVSAGLESTIRGEYEVLGQVGAALRTAVDAGACGPALNHLGRGALALGRRARADTSIASGSVSLSGAAVAAAAAVCGGLVGRRAVVVGSGMMAGKLLRALSGRRLQRLSLVARNLRAGRVLASVSAAEARPWADLREVVETADMVVLATSAATPVLRAIDLTPDRLRVVVDLGSPPNAEVEADSLPGTVVIRLDDLMRRCQANVGQRQGAVAAVEGMIEACVVAEGAWLEARRARWAMSA